MSILYIFESYFILSCFKFLFKMYFCVVLKKLVQRSFCEKLTTKIFPQKEIEAKTGKHKFHMETLATVLRLDAYRKSFCALVVLFVSTFATI